MIIETYKNYNIFYDSIRKYYVKSNGKGSIPQSLKSSYTNIGYARDAIDLYFAKGAKKYAKAES